MKYKTKYNTNVTNINDLLTIRGIKDPERYLYPDKYSLLDPFLLDNISDAAECLIQNIKENNNILIIIDSDQDGFCSAAMLWNYLKSYKSSIKLNYKIHTGKQHGLEDMITEIENSMEKIDLVILPDAGR